MLPKLYLLFLESFLESISEKMTLEEFAKGYTDSPESYTSTVIVISKKDVETYNQKAKTPLDVDAFLAGTQCIIGSVNTPEQAAQMQGKTITMKDKNGNALSLQVGSCALNGDISGLSFGYYWSLAGAPEYILVSEAALSQLTDTPVINTIAIQCDPKAESRLTNQIRSITQMYPIVAHLEIRTELMQEFQDSMSSLKILSGGVSAILILIGIINFISVMLTGIFTRRTELAVMESVGMTKKRNARR